MRSPIEPSTEPRPLQRDEGRPIHFPGLNGVRFFAAFAVMIYHVEVFKTFSGVKSEVTHPFWQVLGPQGVVCFFVLSGFLITYLLLEEQGRRGRIDLRKFYLRRILRIWPLYYFVLVLGFALAWPLAARLGFPEAISRPLAPQIALYAALLPNLSWVAFGTIPFVNPLWSVGVEEQFYLIWPALLRGLRRRVVPLLSGVIALLVAARIGLPAMATTLHPAGVLSPSWEIGLAFFDTLKLECMAIGGLLAQLVHADRKRVLATLRHPVAQVLSMGFVVIALWTGARLGAVDNIVWGGAFGVLILNVATNPRSLLTLEHPLLERLGRISYGLYLYHSFAEAGVLLLLRRLMESGQIALSYFTFNVLLYGASIALTIAVASVSYRYLEKPFLDMKPRFTVVPSRPEVLGRAGGEMG